MTWAAQTNIPLAVANLQRDLASELSKPDSEQRTEYVAWLRRHIAALAKLA